MDFSEIFVKSIAQLIESIAQLIAIGRVCRRPYLFFSRGNQEVFQGVFPQDIFPQAQIC